MRLQYLLQLGSNKVSARSQLLIMSLKQLGSGKPELVSILASPVFLINTRHMHMRVTVLTVCVCLSSVAGTCHKTVIQHGEHENKLFAKFTTFSSHGFL